MNVFMTGATGYIGGTIARRLLDDGHELRGLVRDAEKRRRLASFGVEPVMGGLDDAAILTAEARRLLFRRERRGLVSGHLRCDRATPEAGRVAGLAVRGSGPGARREQRGLHVRLQQPRPRQARPQRVGMAAQTFVRDGLDRGGDAALEQRPNCRPERSEGPSGTTEVLRNWR